MLSNPWPGRILRLIAVVLIVASSVAMAIFIYAAFYLVMIPRRHVHRADLFFDYQSNGPIYDLPSKVA